MRGILRLVVAIALGLAPSGTGGQTAESALRDIEFDYKVSLQHLPKGSKHLELWIPAPQDDERQSVSGLELSSPYPFRLITDPLYGNRAYYCDVTSSLPDSLIAVMRFHVRRREARTLRMTKTSAGDVDKQLKRFLEPDALVPIDGSIAKEAFAVAGDLVGNRNKARALYDHLLATMRYDKSGTGWGQGDAVFACTERRGNCSDIHSLLIGMARALGIPARFTMGFPIPGGRGPAEIAGYHCWADLYLDGEGWVPIDASEAIKHPDKADYFFGTLDANRVAFTIGRDIRLKGDHDSTTVNYFIYPQVLLDGHPYQDVTRQFEFREASSKSKATGDAPSSNAPSLRDGG